ncbi:MULTISPECIES: Lrp/AsnC family transcriptional regulator [Arthrobacter]|uniref:Lrp/AsnC family transcriptional regulator n=1 Tax=unclassified Arthrobacter TaxID=235627 RepID=UPI0024BAE23B|nr:Lrp/AsnC family transcriptional regulator [Arthrobacter sp. H35-MC1]MDJ0317779.1 Lrp/AsnC family transcriptional regulator [Arthrobacter sp. H35-MC1]
MSTLDGTDARILLALIKDPRQTVVAMAESLGISRNTVQARMVALEKRDAFLPFDHRISPGPLGYPLTAFISVHVQQRKISALATALAQIPEVVEAHGLSGRADLLVKVVSTGAEDLFRINGKILSCDGVERTETSLAMNELVPFRMSPLLKRMLKR